MEIRMRIENADQIRNFLNTRPERMKEELNRAIEKSVWQVEQQAKLRSPHKTGRMWTSIQRQVYENKIAGMVYVGVKYAIYFEAPYFKKPRMGGRGESEFFTNAIKATENIRNQFFQIAIKNTIEK